MPWGPLVKPRPPLKTIGYSTKEVAAALGLSIRTVQYAVSHKQLDAIRVSRASVRITEEALKAWLGKGVDADGKLAPMAKARGWALSKRKNK